MKYASVRRRRRFSWILRLVSIFFVVVLLAATGMFSYELITGQRFITPLPSLAKQKYLRNETGDQFITWLEKKQIAYTTIAPVEGNNFLVVLPEKEEVLFSGNKDIAMQVSSLQLILSRLTIEGKRFRRIDFRFDKPLLIFE